MSDLPYTQCVSEEPISGVRCLMPANHDGHRNGGTAWATDHDAWRAEIDAKDAEIERLKATIARVTALVEADEQCGPSIDRGISCPNILDLDAALEEPGDQEAL